MRIASAYKRLIVGSQELLATKADFVSTRFYLVTQVCGFLLQLIELTLLSDKLPFKVSVLT